MRATILNCTLKPSPEKSNTEALASVVAGALAERAQNLVSVARALEAKPTSAPPS